jgi:hypothetical protein
MPELLRILLCSVGVAYLLVRFGRFLRMARQGYYLVTRGSEPGDDWGPADPCGCVSRHDAAPEGRSASSSPDE